MSETVIKVEGLGKKYIIGHQSKGGYKTFRDQIGENLRTVFSKTKKMVSGGMVVESEEVEDFWALKDISFEVKQGDTLGIIGRNGAGKSTLLKILSRITEPTTGKVTLKGRVASLLEVGTGFHPELSGRENIFLNGAILGMSQAEIKRKFDEIVDFSGVEKFLDTPVKRYSSGMYVRLAFSVAAHLEPEILIVDEVLAVGDAEFQKKCLGKMKDVSNNEGRTVLFVSHNLSAVKHLCNKSLFLKQGKFEAIGPSHEIVLLYNQDILAKTTNDFHAVENDYLKILNISFLNENDQEQISIENNIKISVSFECKKEDRSLALSLNFYNEEDLLMFEAFVPFANENNSRKTIYSITLMVPGYTLNSGEYYVSLIIGEDQREVILLLDRFHKIVIEETYLGSGKYLRRFPGLIRPKYSYDIDLR